MHVPLINPLTVLDELTRPKTVVACSVCITSHRQNHQKSPRCFRKRRKFTTTWYTPLFC